MSGEGDRVIENAAGMQRRQAGETSWTREPYFRGALSSCHTVVFVSAV